METVPQPPAQSNKLVPVLVVLLIVASFLIGSLYTQVNLLKKGGTVVSGTGGGTGDGVVAGGQAANPPPPDPGTSVKATIDVTGAPSLGDKNAKVALVEFTDYQCPYCGQLFTQTFPSLKKEYIDTGKIRYFVRDFPLIQIHPLAQKAAEATACANDQGKFWEYHDKLFTNQQALAVDDLKKYAGELGLNASTFVACLDSSKYKDKIAKDQKDGESYGVRGTPASFVGVIEGNTVKDAFLVSGAVPFDTFKQTIDGVLKD